MYCDGHRCTGSSKGTLYPAELPARSTSRECCANPIRASFPPGARGRQPALAAGAPRGLPLPARWFQQRARAVVGCIGVDEVATPQRWLQRRC